MNRLKRTSAATILAGTMLACTITPALAQSPGPDWILIRSVTTNNWAPEPPGSDWVLIGQNNVNQWYADPSAPFVTGGQWSLFSVNDRRYFMADGNVKRVVHDEVRHTKKIGAGITDQITSKVQETKRTSRDEFEAELKNPFNIKRVGSSRVITKLVRYKLWDDVEFDTYWNKFNLSQNQLRVVTTYRQEWMDPVVKKTIFKVEPTPADTGWQNQGSPFQDGVASSGVTPGYRAEKTRYVEREEDAARLALGATDLSAASGPRASIFAGDSGSGASKPGLQAAQVRTSLGASQVNPSEVKASEAENEASLLTIEELKKRYEELLKQLTRQNDAELEAIKKAIEKLPKQEAKTFEGRLDDLKKEVEKLVKDLDGKVNDHYKEAKRNALKLPAYRSLVENGLEDLEDELVAKRDALRFAVENALAAANEPAPISPNSVNSSSTINSGTATPLAQAMPDAIDKLVGSYRSSGGTTVAIARLTNTSNVRIDVTLNLGHKGTISSTSGTSNTWSLTTTKTERVPKLFGGYRDVTYSVPVKLTVDSKGNLLISGNFDSFTAKKQ